MTAARDADRALAAVQRVRRAREQDSRLGLAAALAEQARREQAAALAAGRLVDATPFQSGSVGDFLVRAAHGARLAADTAAARARADRAGTVAAESMHRWRRDRVATRVVELLLERHAAQRRADRARVEARELDDIAGQAWLRRSTGKADQ